MPNQDTATQRYLKLIVLVIVAGNIYPLIYLRQNFEISILESFGITAQQLGQMYAWLGILYVLTYIPSGWLADRVSPRILMSFSLAFAGALGLWFSTFPGFFELQLIFAGWGIAAGLTFWAALIKATNLIAKSNEQGRFFGILDGGRGLVEAILASIAVWILAHYLSVSDQDTPFALQRVIYLYVGCMLVLAPISYFILDDPSTEELKSEQEKSSNVWRDLKVLAAKEEVWLCGICILTGYQLFWATYTFSAYLQTEYQLTAVAAGTITAAKLWMRPIGAVAGGFAGDLIDREGVLGGLMILSAIALASLVFVPAGAGSAILMLIVLTIGFLTYAVRGIFWATLESCHLSNKIKGLAIGMISMVGYSPDVYLPLYNGYLLEHYPNKQAYTIFFLTIAAMGLLGALGAWRLKVLARRQVLPS